MRGYACVLVLGLAAILSGVEMTEESEPKEGSLESSSNVVKVKRKTVEMSNAKNPTFNHLTSGTNSASISSSIANDNNSLRAYLDSIIPPFRYVQTDRYQPLSPSLYLHPVQSGVQLAAQTANRYTLQNPPVGHYLQSPTQIQFISTPAVKQLPILKIRNLNGRLSAIDSISGATADLSPSRYSSKPQTGLTSSSQFSPSTSSQSTKLSLHQTSTPLYYSQHPLVPFSVPQAASYSFLYQHPALNYISKQQSQQYFSGFHTGNRFGFYPAAQANQVSNQLNYLFPVGAATMGGTRGGPSGSELKSSDKLQSANLQSTLPNSFAYGNKV